MKFSNSERFVSKPLMETADSEKLKAIHYSEGNNMRRKQTQILHEKKNVGCPYAEKCQF